MRGVSWWGELMGSADGDGHPAVGRLVAGLLSAGRAGVGGLTVTAAAQDAAALTLGGPTQTYVIQAVAWIVGIIAVCAPIAVAKYRRAV